MTECDIACYSKLVSWKISSDRINQVAERQDSGKFADKHNILRIATNFYKNLYTSKKVNEKMQEKRLENIKTKLSKDKLAMPITEDEVK